jgi:hypothetical protein
MRRREQAMTISYLRLGAKWGPVCALTMLLTACPGQPQKKDAIGAVNNEFRRQYEDIILPEKGTRTFKVRRDAAFADMRVVMARMGMDTESQDSLLGTLRVSGPAPLPLTAEEWDKASKADLPALRRIIEPYVGKLAASQVQFEPKGLDVVINVTFVETGAATEISITVRLRETAPPPSGWPRREYLPPTAVKAGLDKVWAAFDQELRADPQRP